MFSWITCPVCGEPTIGVCCDIISIYLSEYDADVLPALRGSD